MKLKDEKITDKLTALRVERGLTQAELARAVGVSRQTVSRWERGFIVPSAANLISLSRLYGVPLDELMNGEPDGEEETAAPEVLKAPETETAEMEELDAAPVPRRPVFRRVWAAALAGCILMAGLIAGVAIGIAASKEPGDGIIWTDDVVPEYIDVTNVIDMTDKTTNIVP